MEIDSSHAMIKTVSLQLLSFRSHCAVITSFPSNIKLFTVQHKHRNCETRGPAVDEQEHEAKRSKLTGKMAGVKNSQDGSVATQNKSLALKIKSSKQKDPSGYIIGQNGTAKNL